MLAVIVSVLWVDGSKPVTASSYSWEDTAGSVSVPVPVNDAATWIPGLIEYHCRIFVADFVMLSTEPKLVELNAISTSGWYSGMDPASLLSAIIKDQD